MDAQADYDPCRGAGVPEECVHDDVRLCDEYSNFSCDVDYCFSGYTVDGGIPLSGIVSGKKISIQGTYVIESTAKFQSCVFEMAPGAMIWLSPTASATIEFNDCKFFAQECEELWEGIAVDRTAGPLTFRFIGSHLEDARIALALAEGADFTYYVRDNDFINNHIGIENIIQDFFPMTLFLSLNTFAATATLLPNYTAAALPEYPDAYAGVHLVKTQLVPNQLNQTSPVQMHTNTFRCLHHGAILEDCVAALLNNDFENMDQGEGYGIRAIRGTLAIRRCKFEEKGWVGIGATATNLTASGNHFTGKWGSGIVSFNNVLEEKVHLLNNSFDLDADTWFSGIQLERSWVTTTPQFDHSVVSGNVFEVDANCEVLACVLVEDRIATDALQIFSNEVTVHDHQHSIQGVEVDRNAESWGAGNAVRIYNNEIAFDDGTTGLQNNNWGVAVLDLSNDGTFNHEINENTVTGTEPTTGDYTITRGYYLTSGRHYGFCENEADYSYYGFHFRYENEIQFRENHMTHHQNGVYIQADFDPATLIFEGAIDEQYGRGNTWSSNTSDYSLAIRTTGSPLASEFRVSETGPPSGRTYLPPDSKIEPDPSVMGNPNWFDFVGNTPQDHCPATGGGGGDDFSASELLFMAGTLTGLSAAQTWELQRRLYGRILQNPAIAPTPSTAATFFASLSGSSAAAFAQVSYTVATAGSITATDAANFDARRDTIEQTLAAIESLDAGIDLTDANNLTPTFLASRAVLLDELQQQHAAESTLKTTLLADWTTDVQAARTTNSGLTATQPWQKARKLLTDITLGRLLGEPLTATTYQYLLDLAEESPDTTASVPYEAALLLKHCDRERFEELFGEPEVEERQVNSQVSAQKAQTLLLTPNPSNGLVRLSWSDGFTGGMMQVWDAQGRLVSERAVSVGETTLILSLAHLPQGLYRVALVADKGRVWATSNLSIQH